MQFKELKKDLISSGKFDEVVGEIWQIYQDTGIPANLLSPSDLDLSEDEFRAIQQMRGSKRAVKKRLIQHIEFWKKAGYPIVFGTLTFKDQIFSKTNEKTRRRYVQRFLAAEFNDYIANIDFGSSTGREHYHFIAVPEILSRLETVSYETRRGERIKVVSGGISEYEKRFGIALIQPVPEDKTDLSACYVAKLSNHSLKVKQTKLLVKKDTPYQVSIDAERQRQISMNRIGAHYGGSRAWEPWMDEVKNQKISEKIYEKQIKEVSGSVLGALDE